MDAQPLSLRVMAIDDNSMITESIRRRIEQDPSMAWVGVSTGAGDIVADVKGLQPDIVLMDIDIPGVDTFALVERLARDVPQCRVLMLSGHLNPTYLCRAIDCGSWGYVSKGDDAAALIEAVRRVAMGHIAFSKDVEALQKRLCL